ncbi:multiple sugar transport system permease protein [Hydrogenispora ethanolica]|jgi:multiple sugar transport system permease protein|uniref:Multiple sugar transport system permease protein n=1 Tax=Hydrogenispora ethanolica TaxID=1082276 RepID=A0A4V2QD32_HYDET|nr:sugar ABC transporter permease [Hydrogenispora ethanolica]TCL62547.1 multiple sugar transport system permease protein [Hydrogenispora ethanolica]
MSKDHSWTNRAFFKNQMVPYLLLLPAFLFITVFMFYPVVNTFLLSLRNYVLTQKAGWGFAGLDNYQKLLLQDPLFWTSLWNSIIWTVSNVFLQSVLGLYLALLLNRQFKGRGVFRALAFSPWAVAGILVAMMWSFMYSENFGVLNDLLLKSGLIDTRISWFSSMGKAMGAMVFATTWRGIPFFAVSILASLQTIPGEVYESCDVDGASAWHKFIHVTLPMLKDTLILTTLLRTVWTLNIVDIIYSMTKGGPNFSTLTLPVYVIMTFVNSLDLGYASTISVVMALLLLVFSVLYLALSKFGKEDLY